MKKDQYEILFKFIDYLFDSKLIQDKTQEILLDTDEIAEKLNISSNEVSMLIQIMGSFYTYFKPYFADISTKEQSDSEKTQHKKNGKNNNNKRKIKKTNKQERKLIKLSSIKLGKLSDFGYLHNNKPVKIKDVKDDFSEIIELSEEYPFLFLKHQKTLELSDCAKKLTSEFRKFKKLNKRPLSYQIDNLNFVLSN
ncbi:MAG: hypothetical protein GF364_03955 [Candidatus Lokiarchaeota archaeon]|nr:hypothetical protein [Candidatus Lokiarchaeota archaeon]